MKKILVRDNFLVSTSDAVAEGDLRSKSTEAFCRKDVSNHHFCKAPRSMAAPSPSATVSEAQFKIFCRVQSKILFIILLSIGFVTVGFSADADNFKLVQMQLATKTHLTGRFTQIRHIKLLSSPLKSTGIFIFSKTNGLVWKQLTPFQSILKITQSQLTQKIGNGPETVFTKQQQPIIFLFTKIFLSAFKGNMNALTPYFKIHFSGNTHHWIILLVAKNPPMNKAIKSMQLLGGQYVDTAVIDEATGDQLVIHFSQMKSL